MTAQVVSAQPLVEAIEAAVAAKNLAVGNGQKPTVAAGRPYVVAWFDGGTVGNRSLVSRDGWSLTATFQVYGFDPDSVQWAIPRLRAAVLGLFGTEVDGRKVHMPEHRGGPPMDRDDKADPPIWWQADEWRFRTS